MDFDSIIAAARKGDMSYEEVAKQFTEALNKAQKAEEKNTSEREAYIKSLERCLDNAIKDEQFYLADAAIIICLEMFKTEGFTKEMQTSEELRDFQLWVNEYIQDIPNQWKIQKVAHKAYDELRDRMKDSDIVGEFLRTMFG